MNTYTIETGAKCLGERPIYQHSRVYELTVSVVKFSFGSNDQTSTMVRFVIYNFRVCYSFVSNIGLNAF